ncbi:hypothetical protein EMIT047CA2_80112 [Pseudomonas soli]
MPRRHTYSAMRDYDNICIIPENKCLGYS